MEHVSHFNQRMAVYSKDEALMCKVFPSSLGPMAMRWFDGLRKSLTEKPATSLCQLMDRIDKYKRVEEDQ